MTQNQNILQDRIEKELVELTATINEVVESYKRLRSPLIESQQNVPKATQQLDKISEQTEAATQQMLDMVEKITQREGEVASGLNSIKNMATAGKSADMMPVIEELIAKVNTNSNDAFMIMDALQFQDITSQQLNHAVVLLEELEVKLNRILSVLHGEGDKNSEVPPISPKKVRAYDPHADLFAKKTAQEDIDNLFASNK